MKEKEKHDYLISDLITFSVGTGYVGSTRKETVALSDIFDSQEELDGMSEGEISDVLEEYFESWVWENLDATWWKSG